jgi:hypothetical protein
VTIIYFEPSGNLDLTFNPETPPDGLPRSATASNPTNKALPSSVSVSGVKHGIPLPTRQTSNLQKKPNGLIHYPLPLMLSPIVHIARVILRSCHRMRRPPLRPTSRKLWREGTTRFGSTNIMGYLSILIRPTLSFRISFSWVVLLQWIKRGYIHCGIFQPFLRVYLYVGEADLQENYKISSSFIFICNLFSP